MADAPLEECPVCAGRVRRVVNSVGIVFKGSGFYSTDNRNGKDKGSTETAKPTVEKKDKEEKKSSATESESSSAKSEKAAESA